MTEKNYDEQNQISEQKAADRHHEVEILMREIDEKIYKFVKLTGASSKIVKKRWRKIKQSAVVVVQDDKLTRLEALINEKLIKEQGHTVEFLININNIYKNKNLVVVIKTDAEESTIFTSKTTSTAAMFDEALTFFKVK